jgi:uncharacterized phage protein gp47/JayE
VSFASEREYAVYRRGEQREQMLLGVREGLRLVPNPETGVPFTEDEIRRATMKGSRFWRDFDSTDIVLLGEQKRQEFLAQQLRIDRAGSAMLRNYHAILWGEPYLPAFGASGIVLATGNFGVTWSGSTQLPDPGAVYGRDPANRRYQVYISGTADANGEAELTLVATDGGVETNIEVGTVITWANAPLGSEPTAVVTGSRFAGGLDAETDEDYAQRLADRIRHKPASGNWAHIRSFARKASVSVEDAFTYACAFHAGSTLVAVVQKRGVAVGPAARIPSLSVLQAARAALVPPGSSNMPGGQHIVVVPPVAQASNAIARLSQPLDSTAGWTDPEPWPPIIAGTTAVAVSLVSSQTDFRVTAAAGGLLPDGASSSNDLHLMIWDVPTSSFIALAVQTITDLGGGIYRVQLTGAPSDHTIAIGDWISPDMSRRATLASAVNTYFDSLGPGEIIDLDDDDRSGRAFRNPQPSEVYPSRAGQGIVTVITDAMGSTVADASLASITSSVPAVPADPINGPALIVAGKFAVYPL